VAGGIISLCFIMGNRRAPSWSCTLAEKSRTINNGPIVSTRMCRLRPLTLPASHPRSRLVSLLFTDWLPHTQKGGCRRKGQAQPAGSELPHLMSGGVAPGM
jgi:hypothetical protein